MKFSKKVLGMAMGIVMLGSQAMPVLASSTDPAAGTTGGTGNILDYEVETVVVPTTLKIALNPNGYAVTTKYVEVATYAAGTVYYSKEADGSYTKMDPQPTSFTAGTAYYKAVTSTDQVVSLNYGIANKSTGDKNVKVDFAVTYTAVDGKKAIQFVDSAAKAQAYDATNNANGAKKGEYKMYLAVASADDLPTANTYAKTTDTTVNNSKTYYTKSGSTYTKITPADADALKTCYEETTTIGTEITAAELSDVTMTKATAGNQAFVAGTTNKADASIAYGLDAATYALKDGAVIDFTTSQTDLATKLEMSAIGGVAGFTLTGAVNADVDWTEADATAITITPTYTVTDATGAETAVDSGAYNQVNLGPNLNTTTHTIDASNTALTVTVNNLGTETISTVVHTGNNSNLVNAGFAMISGSTVTFTDTYFSYFGAGEVAPIKITTSDGTELTLTITKPQASD